MAFIGGGNMARSLIGGLVARGHGAGRLRVAEPVPALREALAADFGVTAVATAPDAADGAGLWVLAVKPQVLREVCASLAPLAQARRPLVVSIAAGITTAQIDRWLGGGQAVVRTMPNTPALLGAGATGLYANPAVDGGQRAAAEALMQATGITAWIPDEALMDAVTAVSGSGPAYVFLLAELMEQAAIEQGIPPALARQLARETVSGSGALLAASPEATAELRKNVTSPGGTTAAALAVLMDPAALPAALSRAIAAATQRSRELAG